MRVTAVLLCCWAVLAAGRIDKVFVVFSNHLDIGYTQNLSSSVINQYFTEHFPRAVAVTAQARARNLSYRWMTHSWLVSAYRDCPRTPVNLHGPSQPSALICPNATELAAFDAAVRRGDIVWHAFPFNGEPELFTPELFDAALELTAREDRNYGRGPHRTLSLRDVPGLTRAAIPALTRRGVRAVSVGENSQVAPSAVPPIFVWRDEPSGQEVLALFHALGYGGSWPSSSVTREDLALFDDGPGIHLRQDGSVAGGGSRSEACVPVEQASVALCYAWKVDNSGPHSLLEATVVTDTVRALFPGAEVLASDGFDDFVAAVLPVKESLPVVTAEIGDTWIMGADADPKKVALFRAASRVHAECVSTGACAALRVNNDSDALIAFERLLMVAGEHTWWRPAVAAADRVAGAGMAGTSAPAAGPIRSCRPACGARFITRCAGLIKRRRTLPRPSG